VYDTVLRSRSRSRPEPYFFAGAGAGAEKLCYFRLRLRLRLRLQKIPCKWIFRNNLPKKQLKFWRVGAGAGAAENRAAPQHWYDIYVFIVS